MSYRYAIGGIAHIVDEPLPGLAEGGFADIDLAAHFVDELVMLVGGRKYEDDPWQHNEQNEDLSILESGPISKRKAQPESFLKVDGDGEALQGIKEVVPEAMIPCDDDLKDF